MILQFIGFFVVLGGGAFVLWWTSIESYNFLNYQLSLPLNSNDLITFGVMFLLFCVGVGLVYYAATHAPFVVGLEFNLKIQ